MRAPRSNGPPQLAPPMNLIGWPKTIQPCAVTLAAKSMVMAYRANWTHATTSTMVCSTGCSESSPPNETIHMHAAILAMKIVRSASARNANACSAGCGEAPVHGGSAATAVSSRIGVAEKECTSVVDAALRRAGDRCRRRDAASGIVILALLKRGTAVCGCDVAPAVTGVGQWSSQDRAPAWLGIFGGIHEGLETTTWVFWTLPIPCFLVFPPPELQQEPLERETEDLEQSRIWRNAIRLLYGRNARSPTVGAKFDLVGIDASRVPAAAAPRRASWTRFGPSRR